MTVLDEIIAGVREDLAERQQSTSLEDLQELASARPSARAAESVLRDGETVKVIAEVKRSSPCLLYTSPSPRDQRGSRMPSSA